MADTATSALTTLAGSATADVDSIPINDDSAEETKQIILPELMIALQYQNAATIVFSEPADATIIAGNGVFWIDTTASPPTFNCKTRDTSSPEVVINFVLG